jgi:hypothetical protein
LTCVYHKTFEADTAFEGTVCLSPLIEEPEKIHCDNCIFYVEAIDPPAADKFIIELLNNTRNYPKTLTNTTDPVALIKQFYLDFDPSKETGVGVIEKFIICNDNISKLADDYLSQVCWLSPIWRNIVSNCIASITGAGGGGGMIGMFESHIQARYWNINPFTTDYNDLNFGLKKLMEITLYFEQLLSNYQLKWICKSCYEQDLRITQLRTRQQKCGLCNAEVDLLTHAHARDRAYFRIDNDKIYMDVSAIPAVSIFAWHYEKHNNMIRCEHALNSAIDDQKRSK